MKEIWPPDGMDPACWDILIGAQWRWKKLDDPDQFELIVHEDGSGVSFNSGTGWTSQHTGVLSYEQLKWLSDKWFDIFYAIEKYRAREGK
ncbi:hypothetical protein BJD55_gp119 [Gordonia phage Yvonnetastic]|uniref:Uncharacterized protein n=1 Tax=Gordonia phage Yvonnetastic TaxID=1821566 RepID=A0A142K964_9CAUD|nr:hypothetical protein BJD55_gp119 [Gordonia phage Yvonnetastic]AMS02647.1 hypothetical protein SEA_YVONNETASTIC_103 [Gordonia phage Yvonnetastic]WKW86080.1 hypothetical protein SEA_JONJAMES_106 [Gordonia Phage JonJames]